MDEHTLRKKMNLRISKFIVAGRIPETKKKKKKYLPLSTHAARTRSREKPTAQSPKTTMQQADKFSDFFFTKKNALIAINA